jgi:hypothetical protein
VPAPGAHVTIVFRAKSALALAALATACSSGPGAAHSSTDGEAASHNSEGDGGAQVTGGGAGKSQCTVTEMPLNPLPDQLAGFGSPTQEASAVSGTWTNEDGDKLVVTPATSGTYYLWTGGGGYAGSAADGSAFGGGQTVGFALFDTRSMM